MRTAGEVSVVIPTYNRGEHLARCLWPLLRDTALLEVIVVVDGADDGSLGLLQAAARREPRIRPIWQENAGQGVARATGLAQARGTVVLFLDDDVVASEGLVAGHAAAHALHERAVVVGYMPVVLPRPRRPGQAATRLYARDYEEACRAYEEDPGQILRNLWMGNCSLPRVDAVAVDMYRPSQRRGHEDREFGRRCLAAGLLGHFDRSLLAHHLHERSLEQQRAVWRKQADYRGHVSAESREESEWLGRDPPKVLLTMLSPFALDPLYRPVVSLLTAVIRVVGSLRLWRLENLATRVLRQVELLHGSRDSG